MARNPFWSCGPQHYRFDLKYCLKLIGFVTLFTSSIGINGCGVDNVSQTEIIIACQQTIFGYAHSRDAVALDENAALFTNDATLRIGDTLLSGKSEIKAGLAERGPKQEARHIITSVAIDIDRDKNVSGKSYALLYAALTKLPNTQPSAPLALKYILTYQDDLEVRGSVCLIKNRQVIIENVEH